MQVANGLGGSWLLLAAFPLPAAARWHVHGPGV